MRVPMLLSVAMAGCSVAGVSSGSGGLADPSVHPGPKSDAPLTLPPAPAAEEGEEPQARTLEFSWRGSAQLPGLTGLVLQPGGENASAGMGGLTCTVSTLTGDYTDDDDYLPDDEDPQDWDDDDQDDQDQDSQDSDQDQDEGDDNDRLLMLSTSQSTVGVRSEGGAVESFTVPSARQAAFAGAGLLVYSDASMGCRLTVIGDDGVITPHDLPVDACGAVMVVDPVTSTAWLANGDLWSVTADGVATLEAEGVGDLISFEPTVGVPITAFRGGTEVIAHGHWSATTSSGVRALATLEEVGAVLVLTEGEPGGPSYLLGFEAGWGGSMGDHPSPGVDATLAVDGDGTTIGMVMDEQVVFYSVRAL